MMSQLKKIVHVLSYQFILQSIASKTVQLLETMMTLVQHNEKIDH